MQLYAAWLTIVDAELNQQRRPDHLAYLSRLHAAGHVAWAGPFADRSGGLVIYRAASDDEANALAAADPAVSSGARTVIVKGWELLDLEKI